MVQSTGDLNIELLVKKNYCLLALIPKSVYLKQETGSAQQKQLANNIDPSKFKKEEKLKILAELETSFEVIARCWHSNHIQKWSEKHGCQ